MRAVFLSIALLFISNSVWGNFDDAMDAYVNEQFADAFSQFEHLAKIGITDAQFNLGVMYYRGEGVERDIFKGYGWTALAVKNGELSGQRADIAAQIYNSLNEQQQSKAQLVLDDLSKKYSKEAIFKVLEPNFVFESTPDTKVKVLKKVVPKYPGKMNRQGEIGWVDVMYGVARDGSTRNHRIIASSHEGFNKTSLKAIKKWQYQPAKTESGPVEVYGQTMRFVYHLTRITFNERKVRKMVDKQREEAEKGSALQKYHFASFLSGLRSFGDFDLETRNYNEWYFEAAVEGFSPAEFQLGKNVLRGNLCSADSAKSLAWLQRAANQGLTDAQYMLAIEMLSGVRFEKNIDAAISWLTRAADIGDEPSMLKLAWIYATSQDQAYFDNKQAMNYFQRVPDDYNDQLSYLEVAAAVHAANKDFDRASELQNQAVKLAETYGLSLAYYEKPLGLYEGKKEWLEVL